MAQQGKYSDADVETTPRYTDADIAAPQPASTVATPAPRSIPFYTPGYMGDMSGGEGDFYRQFWNAAGKNFSDAWGGVKSNVVDAAKQLKEDPSRIVPMWFGGMMGGLEAVGKAVGTPIDYAINGDIPAAVSSAAGGDPKQAQAYRDEGNFGGEMWELIGKPILLLATGEAVSRAGGMVAEDAAVNQLRVVRGLMSDASPGKSGIDLADAQLAQQALQDAARETYGVGKKGQSALARSLPGRDIKLTDIIKGNPATTSGVEQGNRVLLDLSRKAVDLAGKPADEVNRVYGYLPGKDAAANIQRDLIAQAQAAEKNGLTSYGRALRERAAALDGKTTLGQIFDVKKSANRMADVARNTQEAIDLMDSWGALASAIRKEVYPRYQEMINAGDGPKFDLAAAGRKEGAAMSLRNGVEKRLAKAQQRTDALHTPGETLSQMQHGITKHHTLFGGMVRKGQETGILPSPAGEVNAAGRKAIGKLSPDTVPESVTMTQGAKFSAAPQPHLALPGGTMQFEIPGNLPTLGTEGQIAHSAGQVPRHAFESPAFTTSSAPTRTAEFAPNGRVIAGPEGSAGADISTARTPEAQTDVAKGPGTLITGDVNVARSAMDRMARLANSPGFVDLPQAEQSRILASMRKLRKQINDYDRAAAGGAQVSHTPPSTNYTPRRTGKLPVNHPIRKSAPAAVSSYEREEQDEHQ